MTRRSVRSRVRELIYREKAVQSKGKIYRVVPIGLTRNENIRMMARTPVDKAKRYKVRQWNPSMNKHLYLPKHLHKRRKSRRSPRSAR